MMTSCFSGFCDELHSWWLRFSSRLTEQVREARGLAYGVYSYFANNEHAALWRGSVASDNKTAQQALDVIRAEMRRMAKDGVSAERLASAKTYLTGAYALRFDSGSKIAGQLIGVQLMGLPIDYFTTRNQSINAVTVDDIKRAAQTLLVDNLLVVSVGGTAVTLAPLSETPIAFRPCSFSRSAMIIPQKRGPSSPISCSAYAC